MSFKSPDLKIAELNRDTYYDFENRRRKTLTVTQKVTMRNEQVANTYVFSYGYREGLCHIDKFSFRKISVKGKDIGKRYFLIREIRKTCSLYEKINLTKVLLW